MPWPTTTGTRNLIGAEGNLVRGAIGMMLDALVAEAHDDADRLECGVQWFDQWDVGQRIWLLECVTYALLDSHTIESPAAMFDATVDAIFFEIIDLIEMEIDQESITATTPTWRQSVSEAFACQRGKPPNVDVDSGDLNQWQSLVTQIADPILGVRLYQRAESFRDGDYQQTRTFLRDRGLPEDYLAKIPPLQTVEETQASIDRIQSIVFRDP